MLSKKNRINTALFEEIRSTGKRVKSPYFSIIYKESEIPQYGVVVSKKKLPHAVDRNKQRRKMFAVLEDFLHYPIQAVIFLDKESFSLSQEELAQELKKILKDVHKFRNI